MTTTSILRMISTFLRSSSRYPLGEGRVEIRFTHATDPDLAVGAAPEGPQYCWSHFTAHPCTWLHQVHGRRVVRVDSPGQHAGALADAAITAVTGAALAVVVADCAPIALIGPGVVGVVHGGWRGLEAGVLGAAVAKMRQVSSGSITARLGPCIHGECYEFGRGDLDRLVGRFGPSVQTRTRWRTPALDLPEVVRLELRRHGVALEKPRPEEDRCTACGPGLWSFRARGDRQRQGVVAWIEPALGES